MSLSIHFCGEVAPFFVDDVAIFGQQSHSLYGEGEYGFGALFVEPLHEAFLQPAEAFPVGLAAVREVEIAEETFEIRLVIVSDVPEHSLIVACSGRLVDGVDNLLEAVGDHLVYGTLLEGKVNYLVGFLPVVLAVLQTDEVVEVHQKLRSGTGTAEHA